MTRTLLKTGLLASVLLLPPAAAAQSHAHHGHGVPLTSRGPASDAAAAPAQPNHSTMDHSTMDHSTMDHSTMDHSTMDHSRMDHASTAPPHAGHAATTPAPRAPIPVLTDADRAAAFPPIDHGAMTHASPLNSLLRVDRLEHWHGQQGTGQNWELSGWLGTDLDRVWLRSEGERRDGHTRSADVELLYGRAVSPWWDLLVGVRQDLLPGDGRSWAAFGIQGLAPYKVETSATVYVGAGGQVMAKAEVEYEVLLSNRLILQPLLEATAATRSEPLRGIGTGLNKIEAGLRLRYEVSRRFAPYIGVSHERHFGDAARSAGHHARDTRWLAGVRLWF